MTKKLNTTVHLADPETGESRMLGPNSKLSRADVKQLREGWGKRADEFFEDDGDDPEPEELDQKKVTEEGHPPADSQPADSTPQVKAAQKVRQQD